eukprot:g1251.t1
MEAKNQVLPHDYKAKLDQRINDIWKNFDVNHSNTLDQAEFAKYYDSLKKITAQARSNSTDGGTVFKGFKEKPRNKRYAFEFSSLGLKLKGSNRTVLKGVSGKFEHSQLIAVMGPSGAGKSTFLNTICGRAFYGTPTGEVLMNGVDDTIRNHQSEVGFVPQDDTVFETLTVYENFMFSVALRQPDKSEMERQLVVEDVIQLLELDHVQDVVVGSVDKRGISGGQRKRVNIGLELVADPSILFLDEPTSGLDSTSAKIVMSALKDLANLGMTVIAVIHQPRYSIFALFDHLLLLGKGGKTVYSGPTLFAETYFNSIGFKCPSTENVADFLMDVCAGIIARESDDDFIPERLFDIWNAEGSKSVLQMSKSQHHAVTVTKVQNKVRKLENKAITPYQLQTFLKRCGTYLQIQQKRNLTSNDLICVLDICAFPTKIEKEFLRLIDSQFIKGQELSFRTIKENLTNHIKATNLRLKKIRGDRLKSVVQDREMFMKLIKKNTSAEPTRLEKKKSLMSPNSPAIASQGRTCCDLKGFSPTGFCLQYKWLQYRYFLIQVKTWQTLLQDLAAAAVAGSICGAISLSQEFSVAQYPAVITLTLTLLGVLVSVGAVNTFGSTKLLYFRERGWGLNAFAYYLSRMLVDIILLCIKGSLFAFIYYDLSRPLFNRSELTYICVAVAYAAAPWGYIISITSNKQNAVILTACASFVFGGLTAGVKPSLSDVEDGGPLVQAIFAMSFGRWGVESIVSKWMIGAPEPYWTQAVEFLEKERGFKLQDKTMNENVINLIILGTVLRIITYFLLVSVDRNKQNKETYLTLIQSSPYVKEKLDCFNRNKTKQLEKELAAVKNLLKTKSELRKRGNSRSTLRNFRSYEKENANNRRSMFFLQTMDEMNEFELDENELVNPLRYRKDANALNKPAIASNV